MSGRSHLLATLPLAPVLFLQAHRVRRSIPRMPEPPGPRRGLSGTGPRLKVLIAGDSAAAGVGASHQDEALAGQLVGSLSADYSVEWSLEARTGATTATTLRRLRELDEENFDVAVTSLGVNDVTAGSSRRSWRSRQRELRDLLRGAFGVSGIVVCGLPPVHGFPALPQPLRWYLGERARAFDIDLEADAEAEEGVRFLSLRFSEDPSEMASDGFHPGPAVYARWGRMAALAISQLATERQGD